MASRAQITEALPETLPEDFVGWDEASPSAKPVQSGGGEPAVGVGVVSNPATQAPESQGAAPRSRNLPRGVAPSVSAHGSTGSAAAQRPPQSSPSSRGIASDERQHTAPPPNWAPVATRRALNEILPSSLRANAIEITRSARKKWPIIAGASATMVVILTAAMIPVLNRGSVLSVKPASAPTPATTTIQQPNDPALTRYCPAPVR